MSAVRIPSSGKIKYSTGAQGGSQSGRVMRAYDFNLAAARSLDVLDLNSMWLCCGRDPERRFGGAWLLSATHDVLAFLPHSNKTEFNRSQQKTYLRLWFFQQCPIVKRSLYSTMIVRVLMVERASEMFLTVGPDYRQPVANLRDCGPLNVDPYSEPLKWDLYFPALAPAPMTVPARAPASVHAHVSAAAPQKAPASAPSPAPAPHTTRYEQPQGPPPIFQPWGSQPDWETASQTVPSFPTSSTATYQTVPAPPVTPYNPLAEVNQPKRKREESGGEVFSKVKNLMGAVREAQEAGVIEAEEYDPCQPSAPKRPSSSRASSAVDDPFAVSDDEEEDQVTPPPPPPKAKPAAPKTKASAPPKVGSFFDTIKF